MSILKKFFAGKSKALEAHSYKPEDAVRFLGGFIRLCSVVMAKEIFEHLKFEQTQGSSLGLNPSSLYVMMNEIFMYQVYECLKALVATQESSDLRQHIISELSTRLPHVEYCENKDKFFQSRAEYYANTLEDKQELDADFFQVISLPLQKAIQCGKNLPLKEYPLNVGLSLLSNSTLMSAFMDFGVVYLIGEEIMLTHLMNDTIDFTLPRCFPDRLRNAFYSMRQFGREKEVSRNFAIFIDHVETLWASHDFCLRG